MNRTRAKFGYDSQSGQLAQIQHLRSDDSSILDLAYAYDDRNNITEKAIDGTTTFYDYDQKNQLIQVQVGNTITEQYSYDGVGNRLSSLEYSNWEYNQANQLLRFDNHYYQYDDNGNMIEMNEPDGYKHLSYSVDDRMVNYQSGTTTADYYYDIYGLRVKKEVNSEKTYYVYDGSVLLGEITFDISGQVKDERYYIFVPGTYYPLEMVVLQNGEWKPYAYHNDHLMTPLRLTDENEQIAWSADYKAFGEVNILIGNITNNLRFPGQYNEFFNIIYNYNRYYLSHLKIFNRKEPLLNICINIYDSKEQIFLLAYATFLPIIYNGYIYPNNPLSEIDPQGYIFGYIIKILKCSYYWRKVKDANEQCEKECSGDDVSLEDTIKFIETYSVSGSYTEAIVNCTCQKAGEDICQKWIKACTKITIPPRIKVKP